MENFAGCNVVCAAVHSGDTNNLATCAVFFSLFQDRPTQGVRLLPWLVIGYPN